MKEQMTKIKQMRMLMGLTQKELAKRVGVSTPTVNTMERKGCYDTRTAKKYATAMGCNLIFLLDGLD